MLIFPAIDILGGKCVRLLQGDYNKSKIYEENPLEIAEKWKSLGIKFLHIVDLDAAKHGTSENRDIIAKLAKIVDIELGGGIRTLQDIEKVLNLGVKRAIIGTAAVKNPELVKSAVETFGADKIAVSLDAKKGILTTDGWINTSNISAVDLGVKLKNYGLENIIYTDISTDGMLTGPNVNELLSIKSATGIKITASGGISCAKDLSVLKENNFYAAIVGKAIYEGRITMEEILCLQNG